MKCFRIPAKTERLEEVIGFVEESLAGTDCPPKVKAMIDICVEEIFVNIARYAYEKEGDAAIECGMENGTITIVFTDWGVAYDPLKKEDPDISLGSSERAIGGLGIYITKKSMDDIQYKREDGKNILTIQKKLI